MEELKEKIAEYIRSQFGKLGDYTNEADQLLKLYQDWLKEQIEGLKVIGDEEIKAIIIRVSEEMWSHKAHPRYEYEKGLLQAQLDDVKKHFEEVMK